MHRVSKKYKCSTMRKKLGEKVHFVQLGEGDRLTIHMPKNIFPGCIEFRKNASAQLTFPSSYSSAFNPNLSLKYFVGKKLPKSIQYRNCSMLAKECGRFGCHLHPRKTRFLGPDSYTTYSLHATRYSALYRFVDIDLSMLKSCRKRIHRMRLFAVARAVFDASE
jgi:hypothetical protein